MAGTRERRRRAIVKARELCKRAKRRFRETYRAHKRAEARKLKARLKEWKAEQLEAIAQSCARRRKTIRASASSTAEKAKQLASLARKAKAERKAAHKKSAARVRGGLKAAERRSESADELRHNVEAHEPELLPYLSEVGHKVPAKPKGKSRLEYFLHMAHEHPEQVAAAAARVGDRRFAELLAMQESVWTKRAAKLEGTICRRVTSQARSGKRFALKASEVSALEAIGVNPEKIHAACYLAAKGISQGRSTQKIRLEDVPF